MPKKKLFLNYTMATSEDLKLLPNDALKFILNDIKDIHNSHNIIFKDFSPCKNDFIVFCLYQNTIIGYLHIVPEFEFETGKPLNYFVDFICVHKSFEHKGIANNLYLRGFLILQKIKAHKISAILIDEYSRQAFVKISQFLNLEITEHSAQCKLTATLTKEKQKKDSKK